MIKFLYFLLLLHIFINAIISKTIFEKNVKKIISKMSMEEKIGQMIQAERSNIKQGDIAKYKLGSILSGGGSSPIPNNHNAWIHMINHFQKEAMSTKLKIPLLYGIDAIHGHNNVYGATIFPHNIGLGATQDFNLIEKIGSIVAKEVLATGIRWTFAPCTAVVQDIRWGRTYESFGEDSNLVKKSSAKFIQGLQGNLSSTNIMNNEHILACAKHFMGDGGTKWKTGRNGYIIDRGDVQKSNNSEVLFKLHIAPYIEAIKNNIGTIMVSYSSWNEIPMHEHKFLIQNILKDELDFQGFIISDWNGMHDVKGETLYNKTVNCINAGIDMLMEPYDWKHVIKIMKKAINNEDITINRIDDAVQRILRIKHKVGLFENPFANRSLLSKDILGCQKHRDIAREAVRKSLVLLKNKNNIFPLSISTNILITGKNANNLGNQCGGWTITWQGTSKNNVTIGTTILDGFKKISKGNISYYDNNDNSTKITLNHNETIAVVVIGEKPYAEGKGDNENITLDEIDINILKKIYEINIPIIVILIAGRPLIIPKEHLDQWDALVMAWLPGSEGDGIAEVFYGINNYTFSGKLSVKWPNNNFL